MLEKQDIQLRYPIIAKRRQLWATRQVPPMVSYSAKGINRFTAVNLPAAGRQPDQRDFLLAGSRFKRFTHSNRRLLRSSRSGVMCLSLTPLSLAHSTSHSPLCFKMGCSEWRKTEGFWPVVYVSMPMHLSCILFRRKRVP